ncbi:MAG: YidB family protein [Planctomycetia bacterium]|nr:YidB family protein [Planctomycetia bacterium]
MGILDTVQSMFGTKDASAAQQGGMLESISALINSPQVGGLPGLIDKFKGAGLGHLAEGWVSQGPNPPATADQVRQAIPMDQLRDVAKQLGMDVDGVSQHLAEALPQVVDKLTPEGKLPDGDLDPSAMLAMLKSKFFG